MNYNDIIITKGNETSGFDYIENTLGIAVSKSSRKGLHLLYRQW
jgi:hypothetical protein